MCDVGGGTTDLTLIQVEPAADGLSPPRLTRIGVGDHLMLGGDNMDLALAHLVEKRLLAGGERLSAAQLAQLCSAAARRRAAARRGRAGRAQGHPARRRIAPDRCGALDRATPRRGPAPGGGRLPASGRSRRGAPARRRAAIVEFGLPYPADPAISRHLAAFLRRHARFRAWRSGCPVRARTEMPTEMRTKPQPPLAIPDTLLLNGGVFRADAISARLEGLLAHWRGAPPRVLHNDAPDLAVARGAVAFASCAPGFSAASAPALAAARRAATSWCWRRAAAAARDLRAAARHRIRHRGRAPRASLRAAPRPGGALPPRVLHQRQRVAGRRAGRARRNDDFIHLPPLAARLPATAAGRRENVAVRLVASLTEVGTLEMRCVAIDDDTQRWQLAFQVRAEADTPATEARPAPILAWPRPSPLIDEVFGGQARELDARRYAASYAPASSACSAAATTGTWRCCARSSTPLLERARRRQRSAEHERVWLNLAGYCLRPGLGAALDDWRVDQLWTLFGQGLQYVREGNNWSEWWTLWRRCAGGPTRHASCRSWRCWPSTSKTPTPPAAAATSAGQLRRHGAPGRCLERVPAMHRVEVGKWLLERLARPAERPTPGGRSAASARASRSTAAHTHRGAAGDRRRVAAGRARARLEGRRARRLRRRPARPPHRRPRARPRARTARRGRRRLAALRAPQSWITMVRRSSASTTPTAAAASASAAAGLVLAARWREGRAVAGAPTAPIRSLQAGERRAVDRRQRRVDLEQLRMHLGHAEAEQARAVHLQVALGVGAVGEQVDPRLAAVAVLGPDLPQQAGLLRDGLRQAPHGLRHVLAQGRHRKIDLKKDGHADLLLRRGTEEGAGRTPGRGDPRRSQVRRGSGFIGHSTVAAQVSGPAPNKLTIATCVSYGKTGQVSSAIDAQSR